MGGAASAAVATWRREEREWRVFFSGIIARFDRGGRELRGEEARVGAGGRRGIWFVGFEMVILGRWICPMMNDDE